MTLTVELKRFDSIRAATECTPLIARVRSGTTFGDDMLHHTGIAAVETARSHVQNYLDNRFRSTVIIRWEGEGLPPASVDQ